MVTACWTRLWSGNNRHLFSLFRINHDLSKPITVPKSAFSNFGRQLAAKKTQTLPKFPKATPKTKKTAAPLNAATYKPFAVALAQRASPALLYQASSQTVYMMGCYGIAVICFAWSSYYFFWLRHYPPKGFSVILIFCLNLSYAMVAGLGLFFLMRPYRIIQTITTMPSQSGGPPVLKLKLESAAMLPFIKPRTVFASAKDVVLSHHFFEGDRAASPEALRERQKYQEKKRKLKGGSIFTLPFRQMRFLCWLGFRAVRRVFSAAGFLRLQVDGFNVQWKLDMTAGWALDEGRALDRVVKHRLTS